MPNVCRRLEGWPLHVTCGTIQPDASLNSTIVAASRLLLLTFPPSISVRHQSAKLSRGKKNPPAGARTQTCGPFSTHTRRGTRQDNRCSGRQRHRSGHTLCNSKYTHIFRDLSQGDNVLESLTFIHRYWGIVLIPSITRNRLASVKATSGTNTVQMT